LDKEQGRSKASEIVLKPKGAKSVLLMKKEGADGSSQIVKLKRKQALVGISFDD
jgi:hypothetical protein